MKITIKLTPEEYDEYRAYQKDKKSVANPLISLQMRHEKMCEKVLHVFGASALYADDGVEISITDQKAAKELLSMAQEWF